MSLRSIALAATACAAAFVSTTIATPAHATDISVLAPETVSVAVSYADLNLATASGRAQLDRRIANAARGICGSYFPTDLRMFALVRECRSEAISSARIPTAVASNAGAVTVTGYRVSRAAN